MCGNIAPTDYKHYVLPLLFLRYLSLRYEERYEELEEQVHDPASDYYTEDQFAESGRLQETIRTNLRALSALNGAHLPTNEEPQ